MKVFPINLSFGAELRMTNVVKSKLMGACKLKRYNWVPKQNSNRNEFYMCKKI